jgi:hypothetical protein
MAADDDCSTMIEQLGKRLESVVRSTHAPLPASVNAFAGSSRIGSGPLHNTKLV